MLKNILICMYYFCKSEEKNISTHQNVMFNHKPLIKTLKAEQTVGPRETHTTPGPALEGSSPTWSSLEHFSDPLTMHSRVPGSACTQHCLESTGDMGMALNQRTHPGSLHTHGPSGSRPFTQDPQRSYLLRAKCQEEKAEAAE